MSATISSGVGAAGSPSARGFPTRQELVDHYDQYPRIAATSPLTIKRYGELLDGFERYRKTNRLLEVGCGTGLFLDVARERGWEVQGTEFTDEAVRICRDKGIETHQGGLDSASLGEGAFDIVVCIEVIEHINNPLDTVSLMCRALREGGLYVTTPNFNATERFLVGDRWNIIDYPDHLCYYTPQTLHYLFTRFALKKVRVETTGLSVSRIKASRPPTDRGAGASTFGDESLRAFLEGGWFRRLARRVINGGLTLLGLGNTIKASYEKTASTPSNPWSGESGRQDSS